MTKRIKSKKISWVCSECRKRFHTETKDIKWKDDVAVCGECFEKSITQEDSVKPKLCIHCNGTGYYNEKEGFECRECKGTGVCIKQ